MAGADCSQFVKIYVITLLFLFNLAQPKHLILIKLVIPANSYSCYKTGNQRWSFGDIINWLQAYVDPEVIDFDGKEIN